MRIELRLSALILLCGAALLPSGVAQQYPLAKPPAGHSAQSVPAPAVQNPTQYQLENPNQMRPAHPDDPTSPYATRRPTGAMMTEGMREAVNPCNRNYGGILDNIQSAFDQDVVRNSVTWWGQAATWLFFVLGLLAFWLWVRGRIRQACFTGAAARLVGDRNAAYEIARNAVNEYNKLVDRYDEMKASGGVPVAHEPQLSVAPAEQPAERNDPLYSPVTPSIAPEATHPSNELPKSDEEETEQASSGGAQLEPVITASGVKYIEYAFYLRRTKALQKKNTAQTTTINQLRTRVTELEEKLESFN